MLLGGKLMPLTSLLQVNRAVVHKGYAPFLKTYFFTSFSNILHKWMFYVYLCAKYTAFNKNFFSMKSLVFRNNEVFKSLQCDYWRKPLLVFYLTSWFLAWVYDFSCQQIYFRMFMRFHISLPAYFLTMEYLGDMNIY